MKRKTILFCVLILVLIFIPMMVYANSISDFSMTSVDYFSEYQNRVGAKAKGMGKASIAVADVPSTAFYNPAGLTQLRYPELHIGLPLVYIHPYRKLAIGIGGTGIVSYKYKNSYKDEVKITDIFIPISFRMFSWVSIGINMELLSKSREIEYITEIPKDDHSPYIEIEETVQETGTEFIFNWGLLLSPIDRIKIGLIYKPRAKIIWDADWSSIEYRYDSDGYDVLPSHYGIGLKFDLTNRLIIAADSLVTEWSKVERKENGNIINPEFKNTNNIHIGMEYLIGKREVPFRCGFYTQKDYTSNHKKGDISFITLGTRIYLKDLLSYIWDKYSSKKLYIDLTLSDNHLFSSSNKGETEIDIGIGWIFIPRKERVQKK